MVPDPPLHRVARLSFSALSLFERCSYRYYAERVVGMRPPPGRTVAGRRRRRLAPDRDRGRRPSGARARRPLPSGPSRRALEALVRSLVSGGHGAGARTRDRRSSTRTAGRRWPRRIAGLEGVRVERPFAFELDGVLLNGRLDVLWRSDGERARRRLQDERCSTGVIPTRSWRPSTGRSGSSTPSPACAPAPSEVEVVYQFLEAPDAVVSARSRVADVEALERELGEAIARIREGDFRPTPSPFACSGCPALDRVCAGPGSAPRRTS